MPSSASFCSAHPPIAAGVHQAALLSADGCVPVPDGPGLGVQYDWDFIARQRTALMVFE
jgi:L-alanine-DL-glutamate epimerase-like enolase superfamily enzyme